MVCFTALPPEAYGSRCIAKILNCSTSDHQAETWGLVSIETYRSKPPRLRVGSLMLLHDNHQVHPLVYLTIQVIGACMDILFASTFISKFLSFMLRQIW